MIFSFQSSSASPDSMSQDFDTDLQSKLVKLCTKNGSTEQVKFAVHTLAAMYKNDLIFSPSRGEESKPFNGEKNIFLNILKSLTSPSSLVKKYR